jgi:molybdopterin converting factor subunit 1
MIKIMLFAGLKEKLQADHIYIHADNLTLGELKVKLVEAYPVIKDDLPRAMIAVNEEFLLEDEHMIDPKDDIALIPPVSGG